MVRLNREYVKQLAEFTSNLSLVFLASIFTPLFAGVDSIAILVYPTFKYGPKEDEEKHSHKTHKIVKSR